MTTRSIRRSFHPPFRRVLCAVDFSMTSRTALRYAAALAAGANGQLTVAFVNDPLLVAAAAAAYDERALTATTERELQQFTASAIGSNQSASCRVAVGHPALEIAKMARRDRADLVVLGTRGLGDARKLFFGSTAGRVLRTAQFPVLAVPPPGRRASGPPPGWPQTVLAGVDPGSHAARDVRRVTELARALGSALQLVTVVPALQTPPWLRLRTATRDHQRIVAAKKQLTTMTRPAARDVTVHARLGDPAEQLSAAAADLGAGLIVLLLHPADRPFGTRQGSVTYRVLCRSSVPVLALSPPRRRA